MSFFFFFSFFLMSQKLKGFLGCLWIEHGSETRIIF